MIKIEDPELERLLADASAASGVEPGALLASLLRERVSMANDKENQGSVNPKSENAGFGDITPQKNTIDKSQGELYEKNSLTASPLPPTPIPIIKNVISQSHHHHRNPGKCQVLGIGIRGWLGGERVVLVQSRVYLFRSSPSSSPLGERIVK